MTAPVPPRSGVRRSRSGAVLGGVCAGVARSAGLDPLLLRIAVVAVTVLTGGAGLLAYLAAWVLIPREDAPAAAPQLSAGTPSPVDVRTAWSAVGKDLKSLADDLRRSPSTGPAAAAPPAPGVPAPGAPARGVPGPGDTSPSTTSPGTTSPGTTSPGTTAPADTPAAETPDGAVPTGTGMPRADGTPAGAEPAGPPPGTVPSQRSALEAADDAATALGERLRAPEVQEGARRAAASVSQALAASVDEVGRRVRRDRS
jgi:phage shock protein PspC (stress-responsive transcriptional regulator)